MKALLIDLTRCIGCRACQVACKEWNELPAEKTTFFAGKGYQNPRDLSATTWKLVTYNEVKLRGRYEWVFGNLQCFHCLEPGCESACPVHALKKTAEGPVVYDADKCLGCRYCQMACPFMVPRFEWSSALPEIAKCTLCADRVAAGLETACAKVCPTETIQFGDREKLISEAERRIRINPRQYIHHIYGKDEAGGTCVLVLSNVPFETLGYRKDLPDKPVKMYNREAMEAIPFVMIGLGLTLGAVAWIVNRRVENKKEQLKEGVNHESEK